MTKNLLPSPNRSLLRFLKVKRGGRDYKVFAKDIAELFKRKKRLNMPPVPRFETESVPLGGL